MADKQVIRAHFSSYAEAEEACTRIKTLDGAEAEVSRSNNQMSGDDDLSFGMVGVPGNSSFGTNYPFYAAGMFGFNYIGYGWSDNVEGFDVNTFVLEAQVPPESADIAREIIRSANGRE